MCEAKTFFFIFLQKVSGHISRMYRSKYDYFCLCFFIFSTSFLFSIHFLTLSCVCIIRSHPLNLTLFITFYLYILLLLALLKFILFCQPSQNPLRWENHDEFLAIEYSGVCESTIKGSLE